MKKARKREINYKKLIITLVIIVLVILVFFWYRHLKVETIYVVGNNIIRENEVLENTNLLTYPNLYQVNEEEIVNNLKNNKLINSVKVNKSLSGIVTIELSENKILYQNKNGKYMLSNKEEVELANTDIIVPTLISNINVDLNKFIDKLLLIEDDILKHISEIEYKPTELDKERFLFYMSDGNYVYITLSKITLINSYNEIYPTLEGKKGILYLDSGNHFEIKDKDKEEIKEEIKEVNN